MGRLCALVAGRAGRAGAVKLGSLRSGGRDGTLVVVSADLTRAVEVPRIAPTLQAALDHWSALEGELRHVAHELDEGDMPDAIPLAPEMLAAPLPRGFQFLDASAYLHHVELVRRARGAEMPPHFYEEPLMYQGASDRFLAPTDPIIAADEAWGIDFEAEVAVIVDDVPRGVAYADAAQHIKLVVILNDVSLRNLIPHEIAKGFGFIHGKPRSALSPVAITPDALGQAWDGGKLLLTMAVEVNGAPFGHPHTGVDMHFEFPALVFHAARTRPLTAGTVIGAGTVSNRDVSVGSACLAERRMIEQSELGETVTPYLRFGDRVRIAALSPDGSEPFGAIAQEVVRADSLPLTRHR